MNFNTKAKTKTATTIDLYRRRYRSLEKKVKAQEKLPIDSVVKPAQVVLYFNEHEGNFEKSSMRGYKAAMIFVFEALIEKGDQEATEAMDLLHHQFAGEDERIERADELRRKRKILRTGRQRSSRQKVKRFSKGDAQVLVQELVNMRSHYGGKAAAWFVATTLTGLRPVEWVGAHFEIDPRMMRTLVVKNAKATNGRAHGETRTIVFSGLNEDQNKAIATHMETIREYKEAGEYQIFYDNCRQCVRRAADKLWPERLKHPTLYTARHMFSADAKGAMDRASVAALMGHASIDTASKNYAPAWSGSGSLGVEPSEADVKVVTELNKGKLEKLDLAVTGWSSKIKKSQSEWLVNALSAPDKKQSGSRGGKGGKS